MNDKKTNEEAQFNEHIEAIYRKILAPVDESNLDQDICERLSQIQTKSLFSAPKEDGESVYSSFEDFIKKLSRELRLKLREPGSTCVKTGYKLINEAVTRNRVAMACSVVPPTRRAQAQALGHFPAEKQGPVWEMAVAGANGKKVTEKMVYRVAREAGLDVPDASPSASSILAELRAVWPQLQTGITVKQELLLPFERFDQLLTAKKDRSKVASTSKTTSPNHNFPAGANSATTGAPDDDGGDDNGAEDDVDDSFQDTNENPAKQSASAIPPAHASTDDQMQQEVEASKAPVPEVIPADAGNDQSSSDKNESASTATTPTIVIETAALSDDAQQAPNPQGQPDSFLQAKVWTDDTGVIVGFKTKEHKVAVSAKVDLWHRGYRYDKPKVYWRSRITDQKERDTEFAAILATLQQAGVEVLIG